MINDAMASSKMIGMVQSKTDDEIYSIGCAGKITEYSEIADGRYIINLTGICRFHITKELETLTPYRQIQPDWQHFEKDIQIPKSLGVDREKLLDLLCHYFKQNGMSCDFEKFDDLPDSRLITTLAMICPFEASEKQALLEQMCHLERTETFMTMLEMYCKSSDPLDKLDTKCH